MPAIAVSAARRAFLESHAFVDAGVDLARVRLHVGGPPTWYLRLVHQSAITIGNGVWFISAEKRDDDALVAHELVHVAQYREMGVPRFLLRYLVDLARARFRYSRTLPLEAPAYARQAAARAALDAAHPGGIR
jgi:GNAT superfamily N-acetyltransferase